MRRAIRGQYVWVRQWRPGLAPIWREKGPRSGAVGQILAAREDLEGLHCEARSLRVGGLAGRFAAHVCRPVGLVSRRAVERSRNPYRNQSSLSHPEPPSPTPPPSAAGSPRSTSPNRSALWSVRCGKRPFAPRCCSRAGCVPPSPTAHCTTSLRHTSRWNGRDVSGLWLKESASQSGLRTFGYPQRTRMVETALSASLMRSHLPPCMEKRLAWPTSVCPGGR